MVRLRHLAALVLASCIAVSAQNAATAEPHLSVRLEPPFSIRLASALILSQGTDRTCVIVQDQRFHLERSHKGAGEPQPKVTFVAEGKVTDTEAEQIKNITDDPQIAKLPSSAIAKSGIPFKALREIYASIPRKTRVQYVA